MRKTSDKLWTSFVVSSLGLWLLVSPNTFHFQNRPFILIDWICGALLVFLGEKTRRSPRAIWIWGVAVIGIWMQFSPLLFWVPDAAAYLNDTFVGSLLILVALILYPLPGQLPCVEPSVPPGWSYNPSSWPQRVIIAALAFICWMISRYLAAYQLGYIEVVWDPFFSPGTKSVLESSVSQAFPVPDAGLGAMAYTIEFFSACLGGKNRWRTAPWAVLIFGILVIPVSLVSVVLIILQPLVVGTWCTLCLVTALCMLGAIPFAIGEVTATLQYLKCSRDKPLLSLLFKGGLCPKATKDRKTPSFDCSLFAFLKSSSSGITVPWNLAASVILGTLLMAAPGFFRLTGAAADSDPIAGALVVVTAVISMSEVLRAMRFLNCLFGSWMLLQLFWLNGTPFAYCCHAAVGILLIALSPRAGPIRERWK